MWAIEEIWDTDFDVANGRVFLSKYLNSQNICDNVIKSVFGWDCNAMENLNVYIEALPYEEIGASTPLGAIQRLDMVTPPRIDTLVDDVYSDILVLSYYV